MNYVVEPFAMAVAILSILTDAHTNKDNVVVMANLETMWKVPVHTDPFRLSLGLRKRMQA